MTPFERAEWQATRARLKKRKRQQLKREKLAKQAHANKTAGSRFERAVKLAFELRGFKAERIDESHGFTNGGWDIYVRQLPNMVVQCKATKTKAALLSGLEEARTKNPHQMFWVCFHSYREPEKKAKIMVAYSSRQSGPPSITNPDGFFHVLMRSLNEGQGYPDA
jgi:hypothetical protein